MHMRTMKEILAWLQSVEGLARDAYAQAASSFLDDPQLSIFLKGLAEEEKTHYDLMARLSELLPVLPAPPQSDIRLEPATRERIEGPLRLFAERVAAGGLSRKDALEYVAKVEFSEWNDIFLYVVKSFGGQTRETQRMAATLQDHQAEIERFLRALPPRLRPSLDVGTLPRVWKRKVLIVEDIDLIRELTVGVISKHMSTVEAANGKEALEKIRESFFDAVVTDIQMPVLDGVGLFREAVQAEPELKGRFIFVSSMPSPDAQDFLDRNQLPLLLKPFDPQELIRMIDEIVARPTGT
jgi:CheY-like chemotaxis protein/rubrerythrin